MASDLTYADFILEFPDHATSDTGRQAEIVRALDNAEYSVHRTTWGDRADFGVMYMAAHNLAMKGRTAKHGGGGSGPVSSRSTEAASVGYGQVTDGANSVYMTTPYGVEFVRQMRQLMLTPLVAS